MDDECNQPKGTFKQFIKDNPDPDRLAFPKMKTIKIPFNYKAVMPVPRGIQLDDFNRGLTACKKLGYTAYKVVLGKEERKETDLYAFEFYCADRNVKPPKDIWESMDVKLGKSKKESCFIFYCHKSDQE